MTTLTIHLTEASGRSESFTVESERVRIGSAAYCEVRLPLGEAAPEHLAVESRGMSGLYVEALAMQPPATLDGSPFQVAPLLPTSELVVGSTQIRIAAHAAGGRMPGKEEKQKTRPLAYVAGALILPFAAWQYVPTDEDPVPRAPQAPALFAAARAGCAQTDPGSARVLGSEQLNLADAKRERQPFYPQEGVAAVQLYRSARACFDAAAASESSQQAQASEARLVGELEQGYRTRRARLSHSLKVKNYRVARQEVRALLQLLRGQSGEYVTWLSNLERRIKLLEGDKP